MGLERSVLFAKRYFDIEEIYRQVGWEVYYDRPAYNEDYKPTFIFSKRARRESTEAR